MASSYDILNKSVTDYFDIMYMYVNVTCTVPEGTAAIVPHHKPFIINKYNVTTNKQKVSLLKYLRGKKEFSVALKYVWLKYRFFFDFSCSAHIFTQFT